jgi:hypothetical protein
MTCWDCKGETMVICDQCDGEGCRKGWGRPDCIDGKIPCTTCIDGEIPERRHKSVYERWHK